MTTPQQAKGGKWERDSIRALAAFWRGRYGLDPHKPNQQGRRDRSDINGVSPFAAQAKNWNSWEAAIREGLDGAERQKGNARELYGVALVKRARRPPGDAYAVMTLATWARVLVRLRRAEALLCMHAADAYAEHAADTTADSRSEFPRG